MTSKVFLKRPADTSVLVGEFDGEITAEHMSILVTCQLDILSILYDIPFNDDSIAFDLDDMLEFYASFFTPRRFSELFMSDVGKGYLIAFYTTMTAIKEGTVSVEEGDEYESN